MDRFEIMNTTNQLEKFFAVTANGSVSTSLYEAYVGTEIGSPYLLKMGSQGKTSTPVGARFENGTMLCVCNQLQLFVPEGSGALSAACSIERDSVMVSTNYHGGHTSPIVALFLNLEDAQACFDASGGHKFNDERWRDKTLEVLRAIGVDHLKCSISVADQRFWLLPPSEWLEKVAA